MAPKHSHIQPHIKILPIKHNLETKNLELQHHYIMDF